MYAAEFVAGLALVVWSVALPEREGAVMCKRDPDEYFLLAFLVLLLIAAAGTLVFVAYVIYDSTQRAGVRKTTCASMCEARDTHVFELTPEMCVCTDHKLYLRTVDGAWVGYERSE